MWAVTTASGGHSPANRSLIAAARRKSSGSSAKVSRESWWIASRQVGRRSVAENAKTDQILDDKAAEAGIKYKKRTAGRGEMRTCRWLAGALVCNLVFAGPAAAQPIPGSTAVNTMRPIQLAKLVLKIKRGDSLGKARAGALCILPEEIFWSSGNDVPLAVEEFDDRFREEMNHAGFRLAGDPSNLFEDSRDNSAEYLVGGMITRVEVDLCFPNAGFNNYRESKGSASIDVEWQIYSALERKVVGTLKTTGTAPKQKAAAGPWAILFNAFANSVQQLAANDRLKTALTAPVTDSSIGQKPPANLALLQIAASRVGPATVGEAVASTVLVFATGGEGSGFLISTNGYVLTNQHVVGGSQYVKVRWSDGSEILGEVIRSDKARDVALIKTDAKGRLPLRLRGHPVTIGEDIYAIGAPNGKQFQNSVTKGIVSATRVLDGFNYIQSDVGVTHGNSGGPVVDAKGQVVAITVSGRTDATMLNFLIPIQEAQDFLGLQIVPPK